MRIAKSFLFVLSIMVANIPIVSIVSLIAINGFELIYLLYNSIYSDKRLFRFKIVETIMFLFL
jgi:hypothetical protein